MAKDKDTTKKIKRLRKQLKSHTDRPSTRQGRYNPFDPEKPVKDNGNTILTTKGRIEHAIQTLTNKSKK